MKITLEFNDDEIEEARNSIDGSYFRSMVETIGTEVFRPARKHGYANNDRLNELIDKSDEVREAITLLEDIYLGIVNANK